MPNREIKQIVLVSGEVRELRDAPEGFDGDAYPEVVVHNGRPFYYAGTTEGTPHYKVRDDAST